MKVGQTVSVAYLSQHVTELPLRARVLEAVQDVARIARIGNQEISASTLAERFGFAANRQWTRSVTSPVVSGGGCSCCGC